MLLALVGFVTLFCQGSGPLPMSQFILRADGWDEAQSTVPHYVWLNPSQLIYSTRFPTWSDDITLHLLDIRSRESSVLTGLTSLCNRYGAGCWFEPSQDGKLLLWSGRDGTKARWYVCKMDGTGLCSWPRHAESRLRDTAGEESIAHWSADGLFFTEAERFWKTRSPASVKTWMRSLNDIGKETTYPEFPEPSLGYYADAYEVGNGRMVCTSLFYAEGQPAAEIVSWTAGDPRDILRTRVSIPKSTVSLAEISPDRTRILWRTEEEGGPKPDWPTEDALWVSRINGTGFHKIGGVPAQYGQHFGETHWVPGGKLVSYMYFGKLYTVPAVIGQVPHFIGSQRRGISWGAIVRSEPSS